MCIDFGSNSFEVSFCFFWSKFSNKEMIFQNCKFIILLCKFKEKKPIIAIIRRMDIHRIE